MPRIGVTLQILMVLSLLHFVFLKRVSIQYMKESIGSIHMFLMHDETLKAGSCGSVIASLHLPR